MNTPQAQRDYYAARHAEMQAQLQHAPGDRGAAFFAEAYKAYEGEAQDQMLLLQHAQAGELLDLRFIGPQAEHGEMPLRQFLDIMQPLDRGLNCAAFRLRYGREARKVDDTTRSAMGLRMAGMASGSARVLVVGDSREDLTGTNLLATTVTQAFRLLTAPDEDFYDAVDAVGGTSARHFGQALQKIETHGLAAEFTCQRDAAPWLHWQGTPGEIRRVRNLIDTTRDPERFEQTLQGTVAALADNGSIQLRTGDEKQRVRFPLKLMQQVQRLTLGQGATLQVSTAQYWDAVLKRDVFKHTLLQVG